MHRYRVQLLGETGVTDAAGTPVDLPVGKTFAVLAYLVLEPAGASREDLARLIWPTSAQARQRQSVRQAVWQLRQVLGADALVGEDTVRLVAEVVGSDVGELRAALASGSAEAVARVYGGPLLARFVLPGAPGLEAYVEEQRERLARGAGTLVAEAGLAAAERGDITAAARLLQLAAQIEPAQVQHRMALVDALAGAGRVTEAQQALSATRRDFPDAEYAEELSGRAARLAESSARVSGSGDPLENPELVGRGRELALLAAVWRKASRRTPQRAVVSGGIGAGKSRLAAEFGGLVAQEGGRVIRIAATAAEQELPWAGVATLVRRLLALPGAAGVSAGSELVLHTLVPSHARRTPAGSAAGVAEAAALADAVADLISAVAYEAALLIAVDDAQWLDRPSWTLLSRLAAQLENEPVMFLVLLRSGWLAPGEERALRRIRQLSGTLHLELTPLAAADVAELLAVSATGIDEAEAAQLAHRLHAASRGNPLLLQGLLRALREAGALDCEGEPWTVIPARLPADLPRPRSIEELASERIRELSGAAQRVGGVLAERGTVVGYAELRELSGLADAPLAAAIAELVHSGILGYADDGYVLKHDAYVPALAAVRHATSPRRRYAAAALAAAVLLITGTAGLARFAVADPPRYGGGAIYAALADTLVELRPPSGQRSRWTVRSTPDAVPRIRSLRGPFRTVSEPFVWFADIDSIPELSPFPVEVLQDGSVRELERHERHDVSIIGVAPHGGFVIYRRDNPDTPEYDPQLRIARRDGSGARTIAGQLAIRHAALAPDGEQLAASTLSARDSLVLLDLAGRIREVHVWRFVHTLAWCGDGSLLALVQEEGPPRLQRVRPGIGTTPLRADVTPGPLACSPDGSAAAVRLIVDGTAELRLLDLRTGEHHTLPLPAAAQAHTMRWVSDHLGRHAIALRLDRATSAVRVGQEMQLRAEVLYSDGTTGTAAASFASSASHIAAVRPDGRVIGNREGTAVIRASYGGWFADSVTVWVQGGPGNELLLSEAFDSLDERRWQPFGYPIPVVETVAGVKVLQLRGDGNHLDGILLKEALRSPHGLTLELEFQLTPSAPKWQRLTVMLCGVASEQPDAERDHECRNGEVVSFTYPSHELAKFDAGRVALGAGSEFQEYAVSTGPPRAWMHMALQIQPDGHASLALNHERVATSRLRIAGARDREWRVILAGSAVGTQLYVRNLHVWPGMRY